MMASPVTFPPGRARLETRPSAIGSPLPTKTTGIVVVAPLAPARRRAQGHDARPLGSGRGRPPAPGAPRAFLPHSGTRGSRSVPRRSRARATHREKRRRRSLGFPRRGGVAEDADALGLPRLLGTGGACRGQHGQWPPR
jgi:hypothetical protein